MSETVEKLEQLCLTHPKFLKKGGLCVALVVTQTAKERGLPLEAERLRTDEGGQVAGLGRAAVQKILNTHGITKVLAEEGGRTSRGSLGLMKAYVELLNALHKESALDIDIAFAWWIEKVRVHFASEGPMFNFDTGKSVRANIKDLLDQAKEAQSNGSGTNYVGAMLQHLVGAKLDLILGVGKLTHHGFSVADHSTDRRGDFHVGDVAIHVTTHPNEALVRKCADNLRSGLKPIIISIDEGVEGGSFLLKNSQLSERVDVMDAGQFLTANVFEHSLFNAQECKSTLRKLLTRYNEIVEACETEPSLRVRILQA